MTASKRSAYLYLEAGVFLALSLPPAALLFLDPAKVLLRDWVTSDLGIVAILACIATASAIPTAGKSRTVFRLPSWVSVLLIFAGVVLNFAGNLATIYALTEYGLIITALGLMT